MVGGAIVVVSGQSVLSDSKEEGEGEREVKWRKKRGERKKYKIMICTTIVTMHIFMIIVVIVHLCTFLHPLMWVFFFFFVKIYKMNDFLHFVRLCIH